MIGYYIHHVGRGHADRACAVAAQLRRLGADVTGLSSLTRPSTWAGEWLQLDCDDHPQPFDRTASGALHWVPLGHEGLRSRMAAIAGWIARSAPTAFVSDLSVEVTTLARLHGVPVITTVLPGRRDDRAHQLGFRLAEAIVAPWPDLAPDMCVGLEPYRAKVVHIGGLSRFDGLTAGKLKLPSRTPHHALFLTGAGATAADDVQSPPVLDTRRWDWSYRGPQHWTDDLWPDLCAANVIVTHGGIGAISDIAVADKPAVVLPQARPHAEQKHTAAALKAANLALVLDSVPTRWEPVLEQALGLHTNGWQTWSTGDAARRFARLVTEIARTPVAC